MTEPTAQSIQPTTPAALRNSGHNFNLCRNPAIFVAKAAAILPVETGKFWKVAGDSLAR
ncbi:hypothetical protein [Bradyrhizobium sp. cf659]|uniref:hypothetical protein n=1 Tax=Bradyrhizobium sp. cf659 TaxID=1761771 RepID=UPI001AECA1EE|nr:hypothetical protein [Bradyrhizobium sp. cf659]